MTTKTKTTLSTQKKRKIKTRAVKTKIILNRMTRMMITQTTMMRMKTRTKELKGAKALAKARARVYIKKMMTWKTTKIKNKMKT